MSVRLTTPRQIGLSTQFGFSDDRRAAEVYSFRSAVATNQPVAMRIASEDDWYVVATSISSTKPDEILSGPFDTMEAALTALRIIDAAEGV